MATLLKGWKRQFYFRNFGISYSQCRHFVTCQAMLFGRTSSMLPLSLSKSKKDYFIPVIASTFKNNRYKNQFTCREMSSSSSVGGDDETEGLDVDSDDLDEVAFDSIVDTEEELSHLRVNLFPTEEDEKLKHYLERIFEAASIQNVLDVVEEYERNEDEINIKIASQALVTIWDLQKFIFKVSASFDPERDYVDRPSFIEKICQHPAFMEKIVKPVIENCEKLDDEPLLASFLCLKKLRFNVRGPDCEKFTDECLRRQHTLSLPSISRLCVCLRNEGLYGNFVIAKFYPRLCRHISSMSEDLEVRLISISLRNSFRLVTDSTMDKFRTRIDELKWEFPKWETVTLCKVFLMLIIGKNLGKDSRHVFDLVGEELINRVPNMMLMDLLSLQRFLENGYIQPYGLVEALTKRMLRIVQEGVSSSSVNPRLDLLASISPFLKTFEQRRQISKMLSDYLENHSFEFAPGILLTMLRWIRVKDTKLYDTYWNKASELVVQRYEETISDRRIYRLGKDYVNFCFGLGLGYRNQDFENIVKQYLYKMLESYENGVLSHILLPGDFSKIFGVLIGTASWNEPIFSDLHLLKKLDDVACQFKPAEVGIVCRGVEFVLQSLFNTKRPSQKHYNRVIEICSILEEQCSRFLLLESADNISFTDLLTIHRVCLLTRRVKGESPITEMSMKLLMQKEIEDGRSVKDLAHVLLLGGNNYPEANELMAEFILKNRSKSISPEIIEKFLVESYNVGWENENINEVMEICGENLCRYWDKLNYLHLIQASLSLCYYRHLPKELVQNIFSVKFLDQLDDELKLAHSGNHYPMKLRKAMMELNRAVCIDMPDMNLPWFHAKFCEDLLAIRSSQNSYLHSEVRSVLSRIVGDETAVQVNMCSPYYHTIDFLIEFDEKSRPIRKIRRQPSRFFEKFRQNPQHEHEVRRKVAVLILQQSSFTRGVRALKGRCKLLRRHLEMLGYDVIEIDPVYWNSMFMSETVVRESFLESRLYANAGAG